MTDYKLITCVLPVGVAMPVVRKLKSEKGVVTANVNNARGVGKLTAREHRRLGNQTEKQIMTVVVPAARADEIFAFIYHEAGINQPHGGLMYVHGLARSTEFALPDLPEED